MFDTNRVFLPVTWLFFSVHTENKFDHMRWALNFRCSTYIVRTIQFIKGNFQFLSWKSGLYRLRRTFGFSNQNLGAWVKNPKCINLSGSVKRDLIIWEQSLRNFLQTPKPSFSTTEEFLSWNCAELKSPSRGKKIVSGTQSSGHMDLWRFWMG